MSKRSSVIKGGIVFSLLILIPLTGYFLTQKEIKIQTKSGFPSENVVTNENKKPQLAELISANNYSGLPIGEITVHKADNEKGIAVLIPQNHRYPGSEVSDSRNDSAEITQNQIYTILEMLNSRYGIDLVLAEGDTYGDIPEEKMSALKNKIELRDQLSEEFDSLRSALEKNNLDENTQKDLFARADELIKSLDREIILAGAPYVLKAKGTDMKLIGLENSDTYAQCAELVKDYIYQKDRMAQYNQVTSASAQKSGNILDLLKSTQNANTGALFNSSNLSSLQKLLSAIGYKGNGSLEKDISILSSESEGQGLTEIKSILGKIASICKSLKNSNTEQIGTNAYGSNPYQNVSKQKLASMISDSEKKIQSLVIDQRNRETAENFVRALNENNENTGIIQFGAGHEEGITAELNKLGITVVVIKSQEVMNRQGDDSGASSTQSSFAE